MNAQRMTQWLDAAAYVVGIVVAGFAFGLLSGCASAPQERTFFYHEANQSAAWKLTADWVKADPVHRTFSTVAFTGSMRPKITGGEFLLLLRYEPGTPVLPGQIVVYSRPAGAPILHRVLLSGGRTGALFIKGDNNLQDDGWISTERVRFVLIAVVSYPGQEGRR